MLTSGRRFSTRSSRSRALKIEPMTSPSPRGGKGSSVVVSEETSWKDVHVDTHRQLIGHTPHQCLCTEPDPLSPRTSHRKLCAIEGRNMGTSEVRKMPKMRRKLANLILDTYMTLELRLNPTSPSSTHHLAASTPAFHQH